jgi:hypothetical protein
MPPEYKTAKFTGIEDEGLELTVHMCMGDGSGAVEFFTPGGTPVVIDKRQFERLIAWVQGQFEILSNSTNAQTVH